MENAALPSKMQPALIGGVTLGVLSAFPFIGALNCICCLWVVLGGVVAAYFYQKESPVPVLYGDGAVLGLLTGVIGAVVGTIVSIPFSLLQFELGSGLIEEVLRDLERNPDVPREVFELIQSLLQPGAFAVTSLLVELVFSLVIYSIFAMLGAILGVAIFQNQRKGAAGTPPPTPPPSVPPPSPPAQ